MSNTTTKAEFTIEDVSPLFVYDDKWTTGDKIGDGLANRYSTNSTFTLSTASGASATFVFNGSSVTIAGAKRGNHGPFSVSLDGQTTNGDGFSADPGLFQVPLFQVDNLPETSPHTLIIKNLRVNDAKQFLDIDFIKWKTTTKGDGSIKVLEDNSAQFSYTPDSAWSSDISALPGFSSNTGRSTTSRTASASLTFQGDVVELIGSVGPNHGSMTVTLNGGTQTLNLLKTNYQAQTVLFHSSGLGAGNHTLVITPTSNGNSGLVAIDQAKVWDFQGDAQAPTPAKSGFSTGIIAAIAVVAVVGLLALSIIGFFLWRRRKQRKAEGVPPNSGDSFGQQPQTAQSVYTTAWRPETTYTASSRPAQSEYGHPPNHSQPNYQNSESTHNLVYPLPNPHSDTASSVQLAYDGASAYGSSAYSESAHGPPPSRSAGSRRGHGPQSSMSSTSTSALPRGGYTSSPPNTSSNSHFTYPPEKGRAVPPRSLPNPQSSDISFGSGREQDGGPAPAAMLPPAYEQATGGPRGY